MKHILLFLPFTALFTSLVAVSIQIYLLIQHRRRERAEKTDLLGRYHMRETKLVDSFTIISRGYLKTDGHACFCSKQFDFCSDRCPMFQYVIHTKPMPEHSPTHLEFVFDCPYFPYEYQTQNLNDERKVRKHGLVR